MPAADNQPIGPKLDAIALAADAIPDTAPLATFLVISLAAAEDDTFDNVVNFTIYGLFCIASIFCSIVSNVFCVMDFTPNLFISISKLPNSVA